MDPLVEHSATAWKTVPQPSSSAETCKEVRACLNGSGPGFHCITSATAKCFQTRRPRSVLQAEAQVGYSERECEQIANALAAAARLSPTGVNDAKPESSVPQNSKEEKNIWADALCNSEPTCPNDHPLKEKKSEGCFECDCC